MCSGHSSVQDSPTILLSSLSRYLLHILFPFSSSLQRATHETLVSEVAVTHQDEEEDEEEEDEEGKWGQKKIKNGSGRRQRFRRKLVRT